MILKRVKTHCCCCIDLRLGCVLIFITEILFSFLGLCLGSYNKTNPFWILGRLGYMLHLVGTSMLLVGILFQHTDLLLMYLITNIIHMLLGTTYIIIWVVRCPYCFYQLCISTVGIVLSMYFWLVVYLFRRKCFWLRSPNNDQ